MSADLQWFVIGANLGSTAAKFGIPPRLGSARLRVQDSPSIIAARA